MRKAWKYTAIDLFLRARSGQRDLLASREAFRQPGVTDTLNNIVIYSTTALGDFMMNSPAIYALRQRFPAARITLVAHPKFKAFFDGGRDWDRVVYWNSKVKTVGALVRTLRDRGAPDLAVILHSHPPYDYLSAVLSGARFVFRDNYHDDVAPMNKWLTNYTIGFRGHLIQRKLELIAPLGCDIRDVAMKLPQWPAPVASRETTRILGFQMGASSPERCWPADHFATVANTLLARDAQLRVVLIGGPGEKHLVDPFMALVRPELQSRIDNQIGNTTLPALVETINRFDVLLTGDTGPMHIAIALKVPTVCLFVTEEPSSSGPYQQVERHRVLYGVRTALNEGARAERAMRTIATPEAIAAVCDAGNLGR
ncbi:glycosyltransferase family 9 protein [Pantoea sp. 1.19]|uniref:glycosyltransferase family 9 protein n=1 Tax=Pantoea sp. 1.19 TaxID=1925589 RepID=UPI0009489638|nr:glycosyltransferase family 9 protein [Pantoea sp. 1.19]